MAVCTATICDSLGRQGAPEDPRRHSGSSGGCGGSSFGRWDTGVQCNWADSATSAQPKMDSAREAAAPEEAAAAPEEAAVQDAGAVAGSPATVASPAAVDAAVTAESSEIIRDDSHSPEGVAPGVLCAALAAVYRSLVAMAKRQSGTEQRLTRFHSKAEPSLGIEPYMDRMRQYFSCSNSCHVMALIYIDRLVKMNPTFVVSSLTVHRLVAVATVIAAKFVDDVYFSNAYYAKVCGLSLPEMNTLEASFLCLVRWRLSVPIQEYEAYLSQVMRAAGGEQQ
eukprot:TRINITY_DN75129_c0_g1_i1.p1 TRINITY_DN75129_c0_g1~~TRINITY_DN75129_c0_g1_i1.p1  ORF type:complete len:290 (-),score=62.28 TRINITY_DN75129_c0_g1_i1:39-878(-)